MAYEVYDDKLPVLISCSPWRNPKTPESNSGFSIKTYDPSKNLIDVSNQFSLDASSFTQCDDPNNSYNELGECILCSDLSSPGDDQAGCITDVPSPLVSEGSNPILSEESIRTTLRMDRNLADFVEE